MNSTRKGKMRAGLTARLGLVGPLILAPMAGGASTPELAAAASNTGALGSLGGAYLNPVELEKVIRKTAQLTSRPFAVNLFAPVAEPELKEKQIQAAVAATRSYRRDLGLPDPTLKPPYCPRFEEQFAVILNERPAVFSFTFGVIDRQLLAECRKRDILTIGSATTLEEALTLEESGVDAIIAQGAEAGAHRATFSPAREDPLIGLAALVPVLAGRLSIPIVAAGGIMNGAGIAAALALGADAAQLGTAFLACEESGISGPYRAALLDPARGVTRLTRSFSGRWARGLPNRFMLEMAGKEETILPFPAQNALTQDIRKKAGEVGSADYLSLWAGQGVGLIRPMKARTLVETIFRETSESIEAAERLWR
jgi:nitronate monooxygenase